MTRYTIVVIITLAVGASIAVADKLSDFKDAASKAGCDSIPYGDLRSDCKSEGGRVHEYCDGSRGPVSCGSASITRDLKDALEREKRAVEELKDKKRRLEDQKSRTEDEAEKNRLADAIGDVEDEIYQAEQRVSRAITDLEARGRLVNDAIYTIGKCMDYRRATMNIFAYALDKVRNEDETPEIKDLARQLRDKYEAEKRGHEIAITDKENALDTCKRSVP